MDAGADWSDLQLLELVARETTLSGAARRLGVDQTTAARRLAALERRLEASLFDRIAGRLVPTPVLAAVLGRLRTMAEEAVLAAAALARASAELQGSVRVTAVGTLLASALAPRLHELVRDHPGLQIELLADDQMLSFERRETDIALRHSRAGEDWARLKSLGTLRFRLCRPAALDARAGAPPVLRYGDELGHVPEMQALDRLRPGARAALRSSRLDILTAAALSVGAEMMLPEPLLRTDPRFVPVEDPAATAERPVYLLLHPDRARSPSVALVAGWIERTVRAWCMPAGHPGGAA